MPYFVILVLFLFSISSSYAQISADYWNGGAVRVGPSTTNCDANASGAIRFDNSMNVLKYCDGSGWRTVGAAVSGSDNTPDAFSFTDVANQSLNTMIFSNVTTITGIDPDQVVTVTGAGMPQISVNSGPWVNAANISPGEQLQVRLISSSTVNSLRSAVVTVGSVSDTWGVTTRLGQTYVFSTSTTYTGDFGGINVADSICQTRANAAGLAGVWKAIMSDATTDAKDRLTIIYPVVNLNGDIIASVNFWSESFMARAHTEFNVEQGDTMAQNVWGGTTTGGVKSNHSCNGWTSTAALGRSNTILAGDNIYGGYSAANQSCADALRIACMQQ